MMELGGWRWMKAAPTFLPVFEPSEEKRTSGSMSDGVTVRKAMRGDDDGKRGTWLEPRTADKGDSQRGDPERGRSVETWAACGRRVDWKRGPDGDLSGRQRQDFDRYATVREEEKRNNDSILKTSCCVPI